MSALNDVKSYMEFWGWTDGGSPGSVKHGIKGQVIARHGDAHWVVDVKNACNTLQRLHYRVLDEQEASTRDKEA